MSKKVSVLPPVNINDEDASLFLPYLSFELSPLKVKRLTNAFVTCTGFCVTKNGLLKESHHDYPPQFDYFLKLASVSYEEAYENPDNLVVLDDDNTYLSIHHPWFMYYHWICESVFRIWRVKDKIDQMVLLLPESYKKSEFVMSSLEPFRFKDIFFIPEHKSILVRKLCMPQIKPLMEVYNYGMMKEVRAFYLNYVLNEKNINVNCGERIYLSRKKADRRKVDNEDEVVSILLRYNFAILYNEEYNFFEQVAIYGQAKYLVSIHGSGLTNMLFMPKNASVFELHKKRTNLHDWHSLIFWYMAGTLGHRYYHQICTPTDIDQDIFQANLIVDTALLEKNLSIMFPS